MSAAEDVTTEMIGDVLWLKINRPEKRNALSRGTLAGIARVCSEFSADHQLKSMVLTGAGQNAFAAGGDLKELASVRTQAEAGEFFDEASRAVDAIRSFPLPVVAALNGAALGGGAELALACDFRVAASHSSIGYIQSNLNVSCGFGGGADLLRLLGPQAALTHLLSASALPAACALDRGIVDRVITAAETLEDGVQGFLEPLLKHPPQVIRAHTALIRGGRGNCKESERLRALEREWFVRTWTHPDHWQAVAEVTRRWQEKRR
jgi:enoyl-CoA hydratase